MKNTEQTLFIAFVRQYQAGLRAYIRSLGIQSASVDDMAQETFLVAYKQMHKFDANEDFGYWLRGIARNLIRNELAKSTRQSRILDAGLTDFLLNELTLEYQTPEQDVDEVQALAHCINKLPEKSRQLVAGKYQQEHHNALLAEQNSMTETAVRIALMRIRNQLKDCITQQLGYQNG
ncbi:sigma-70 family RNA polymerase sigma factor [Gayadomonas joobiniege]|uniref:sigma-70 family RNA polymerase sigma factor n=1 Tax=Gayadomonas joobiniege TaxID=1234606 RepID=UPI000360A03F|nr:sigma-70 family RNA polymerase sigma factor [Gayadomonas joobiniege]